MATMKWTGMDEYLAKLERLTDDREYIGTAIYAGADIVANSIRAQINALPVGPGWGNKGEKIRTITSVQKKGLQDGFGIARMRKDGDYYNVKLGFEGYNGQKTHSHPTGQPNSMIARSICAGTSFRAQNDFVGRAIRKEKTNAEKKMEQTFEEALAKLW